jgi:site-specific DNA recombinase
VDRFICYAVDRWARQQNHLGILFDEIETASVQLAFVTEQFENTAMGRFILAARAMVAEVEREKIVERTTRGKAERARLGKLPQATGKGIYGYRYNPETGTRELHPEQAPVVARIFAEFAAGASTMAITNRLNAEGIPTFSGKQ